MYTELRKLFSSSNTKLVLAGASMPFIGYGLGYASGYHGPSKGEVNHNKKLIEINKKYLKESINDLNDLRKSGRKGAKYEQELADAEYNVNLHKRELKQNSDHLNYITSKKYKKDNAKKNATVGAKVGTASGLLTGMLAKK